MSTLIERMLRLHEGVRSKPYRCPTGHLTIGVGRNLDANGISEGEISVLLGNDINRFRGELYKALPWIGQLDEVRFNVLLDMAFNLGTKGLLTFKNTLAAVERGDWGKAADGMLASKWARQVGQRAKRLSGMMRTGAVPVELE